jgi:hypothetical protein
MPAFAIYLRLGWVSSRNGLLFCTDDASHRVLLQIWRVLFSFRPSQSI